MTTFILNIESEELLRRAEQFANENQLQAIIYDEEDLEDIILAKMIKEGQTGEYINNDKFLESLGN